MHPALSSILSVVTLASASLAQSDAGSHLLPLPTPLRHAGVYHVASGTWTRNASMADLGADRIYVNTCPSNYFSALAGDTYIDEGRLPSPSSPTNANSRPGCAQSYTVEGFEVSYCTDSFSVIWSWAFFDNYTPCASVSGLPPVANFSVSGLPGPAGGVATCWTVQLDTAGTTPPVTPFVLSANVFGWSMSSNLVGAAGSGTGPVTAGDFNVCTGFDGTRWDNGTAPGWPNNLFEDGTGMGTLDQFRIEGGPTTPGCFFFGGPPNPLASFHLRLFSNACPPTQPGTSFCCGTCSSFSSCPCSNCAPGVAAVCTGCLNSLGTGGRLEGVVCLMPPCIVAGGASISADAVRLLGSGMPNASALYFQGTTQQGGGQGGPFGDGLRCAGGVVIRLGIKTNVAGASSYPEATDAPISVRGQITVPGTRTYQVWYRNAAAFCTAQAFNLTNGYEIVWGP
jgi:hypothetical protein